MQPKDKEEEEFSSAPSQSPEESFEYSYQKTRQILIEDLLNRVKSSSSKFFERLVVDLLVRVGYGGSIKEAGRAIGKSGDEGIDGIIKEDVLGLDSFKLRNVMVLLTGQKFRNLQVHFKDKELRKEYLLRLDPSPRKLKNLFPRSNSTSGMMMK
jgi:Restriction endonuclease